MITNATEEHTHSVLPFDRTNVREMRERVKLAEVCEILDSKRVPITKNKRIAGPYPYYGANGVQDYVENYIFDDDLVLLAEDGGHFEKGEQIAYRVSGKCWVNNHAHVLKPKSNIDVDYLYLSLRTYDTSKLTNGATRKKLTQAAMREMVVPMRSMSEQLEIVKLFMTIESQITLAETQIEKLDLLVKSRFVEMFGDVVANSKGWQTYSLGEVSPQKGLKIPSSGNVWQLNLDAVESDTGKVIEKVLVDAADIKTSNVGFNTEHVLYSKLRPYLNKVVLPDESGVCTTEMVPLLPDKEILNRVYLCYVLRSDTFVSYISKHTGGAKMPRVDMKTFKAFQAPIPPLPLQHDFANFAHKVEHLRETAQSQISTLRTLYNSLAQDYFAI